MAQICILCHNAFWFQGAPFEPEAPGEPEDGVFRALVALYRGLNADAICLQEVQGEAVFRRLREALRMRGAFRAGGRLRQYGGAMLWRSGARVADSGGVEDPPQRMWQVARVSVDEGEVVVCNVHLPSARQLGRAAAAKRRVEELAAAVEAGPDVVAGDFNEAPGGPVGAFLAEAGYVDTAVLAGKEDTGTSLGGKRGDQIWVRAPWASRVIEYGVVPMAKLAASMDGKTHLSDHLPLWVRLEAGGRA